MSSSSSDEDDDSSGICSESDSVVDGEAPLTFADHKANGNQSYKDKEYRDAIGHYTKAIDCALAIHNEQTSSHQVEASNNDNNNNNDTAMTSNGNNNDETIDKSLLAAVYSNRAAVYMMLLMYKEALDDCNAAIAADPHFLKVHWRKAKVLTTLGRLDEARKAYSMGLVHDPNDSKALQERDAAEKLQERFNLAQDLVSKLQQQNKHNNTHAKKDARQALAQIELVLASCPNWTQATIIQLQAMVGMATPAKIDEAYALTTKIMRRQGMLANTTLLLVRARCLYFQGAMDDARKHVKQVLASDPDNAQALALFKTIKLLQQQKTDADTAYKGRQYESAMELYTKALDTCPSDHASFRSKLWFNRAACHNALRKHKECVQDCTQALTLNPEYTKALLRRAASNLLIGGKAECEQAIRDYESAHALSRNNEQEQNDIEEKLRQAKIQLKRAGKIDMYKVLGVSQDATAAEIKKAYRKMALQYHPDRLTTASDEEKEAAEAKFRQVNLAHEILSDEVKRKRYDAGVDEQDIDDPHARPGGGHHHGGFGGMDQDMLFEMFMRQQMGGRGGGRRSARGGGFPGGGFHFG